MITKSFTNFQPNQLSNILKLATNTGSTSKIQIGNYTSEKNHNSKTNLLQAKYLSINNKKLK